MMMHTAQLASPREMPKFQPPPPLLFSPSLYNKEKRKWQAYDGGRVLISFSLQSSPLAYKYHKYALHAGIRTQFVLLLLKIRITTTSTK